MLGTHHAVIVMGPDHIQGPVQAHNHPRRVAAVDALQVCHQPLPLLTVSLKAMLRGQHHEMNQPMLE